MKLSAYATLIAALAFASVSFAASGTAIPGGNQATTYVINKSGSYYLAANRVMTDNTKHAIEIKATDVTLDLNGYTLSFANPEGGSGDGIRSDLSDNVEIRNGTITDVPLSAIHLANKDANSRRLVDLRISLAGYWGIIARGSNVLVERCSVSHTGNSGLMIDGLNLTVRSCSLNNIGQLGIDATGHCLISGNSLFNIGLTGIRARFQHLGPEDRRGSIIENNTIDDAHSAGSPGSGIISDRASIVRGNRVANTNGVGISASDGSLLENNLVADATSAFGITATCVLRDNTAWKVTNFATGPYVNAGGNFKN